MEISSFFSILYKKNYAQKNKRLSIYKINSIEWDEEEYKDNGILCRNAVAKGNKVVNDYTALYGGDAYLPANNLAYKYVA